jgi:ADP-ribose pyrophosphatase YjhB (NUDIX family)
LVHVGETLEAAVVREALEETGLHVVPVGPAELVERIFRDDFGRTRYHYVLADFLCEARGGVLEAGSDAAEVRWAREDELADLGVAEVTVRVIGNAFRCLRGSRGGRRVSLRSLNLKNTCLKT